ncbi:MAG: sialidase family protein [Paracoccaceae bacterium]
MSIFSLPSNISGIIERMNGKVQTFSNGWQAALLPSPCVQNHAAFLYRGLVGDLRCAWFAGGLEGKSDICIHSSILDEKSGLWQSAQALTDDPVRSEQNPVLFSPDGQRTLLFHTAQPGGNQDQCIVRMREVGKSPRNTDLPTGSFVRARPIVRSDGAWLLPLHHCTHVPGSRWTGRHDYASVAITTDEGHSWRCVNVPNSTGCVHMTLVPLDGDKIIALFRRRQADFVYKTLSEDGGESWQEPTATNIPNNNSSIAAMRMKDGRIALVCNPVNAQMDSSRRDSLYDELGIDERPEAAGGCQPIWGVARAPLSLFFSTGDGEHFGDEIILWNSSGNCLTNNSEDGLNQELSYPTILQSDSGDLNIAFTLHRRAIAHICIPYSAFE